MSEPAALEKEALSSHIYKRIAAILIVVAFLCVGYLGLYNKMLGIENLFGERAEEKKQKVQDRKPSVEEQREAQRRRDNDLIKNY